MVIGAVHLEIACDYSAAEFLSCFTKFASRRGIPRVVYSDNALNLVNVSTELRKALSSKSWSEKVANFNAQHNITWHFIPPRASHFGGKWERSVQIFKRHLLKTVGKIPLRLETFQLFATQIEGIMNSRPISPMSNDPQDLTPLTPGHFLIGQPINMLPTLEKVGLQHLNYVKHLKLVDELREQFWKRWKAEYLQSLQRRSKWQTNQPPVKVGDIGITATNPYLFTWEMCRVLKVYPGDDGHIRVVLIKTPTKTVKRSVTEISFLPVQSVES